MKEIYENPNLKMVSFSEENIVTGSANVMDVAESFNQVGGTTHEGAANLGNVSFIF